MPSVDTESVLETPLSREAWFRLLLPLSQAAEDIIDQHLKCRPPNSSVRYRDTEGSMLQQGPASRVATVKLLFSRQASL